MEDINKEIRILETKLAGLYKKREKAEKPKKKKQLDELLKKSKFFRLTKRAVGSYDNIFLATSADDLEQGGFTENYYDDEVDVAISIDEISAEEASNSLEDASHLLVVDKLNKILWDSDIGGDYEKIFDMKIALENGAKDG